MTGRWARRAVGGALAIVSAGALSWLSEAPYTAEPTAHGVIRLAWRARGERVRRCRRLTPDELAKLPAHMRQEEVCERAMLPYRLRVTVDGAPAIDELVRAGGAREDRPLFVFRELSVAPGAHHITVAFERASGGDAEDEHEDEGKDDRAQRRELRESTVRETPDHLALDETVTLAPRAILLVTYDDEGQRLRLLAAPPVGS
jgi:hypothetical protein